MYFESFSINYRKFDSIPSGHGMAYDKEKGLKYIEGTLLDGRFHGFIKKYYIEDEHNLSLSFCARYKDGKQHQILCMYHSNGKLMKRGICEKNFNGQFLNRKFAVFYKENGVISFKNSYKEPNN